MTSYSTKVIAHGTSRRLEIHADGKPWGERFPGQDDLDLSVHGAESVVVNMDYIRAFVDSDGLRPMVERTQTPDARAPLDRQEIRMQAYGDFDSDGRPISSPYLEVHIGRSSRKYDLQMAEALVATNNAITQFMLIEKAGELDASLASRSSAALALLSLDLQTIAHSLVMPDPDGELLDTTSALDELLERRWMAQQSKEGK